LIQESITTIFYPIALLAKINIANYLCSREPTGRDATATPQSAASLDPGFRYEGSVKCYMQLLLPSVDNFKIERACSTQNILQSAIRAHGTVYLFFLKVALTNPPTCFFSEHSHGRHAP
jgi:hypothetical protein